MNTSSRDWRRAYLVLLIPALMWTSGIGLSPCLMASGGETGGILLRIAYSPVCHQQPDRSFHLMGFPLAVCQRCSAIYAGFAIGLLLFPLYAQKWKADFRLAPFLLFLLPVALDYTLDVLGVWKNSPGSRAISGCVAGIGLAGFVAPAWIEAWSQLFRRTPIHQQPGLHDE